MQITIGNDLRYSYCDAHAATLVEINGDKTAVYAGQCANGHTYEQEFEIEELKKMAFIENGEIVYGSGKGFKAEDLEEY